MSELVKYLVYGLHQLRIGSHVVRKSVESGVEWGGRRLAIVGIDATSQIPHDVVYGLQRASEVEYLVFLEMGVLKSYAPDGVSYVEEVLKREVVALLLNAPELVRLFQPLGYGGMLAADGHAINHALAQCGEAFLLQQFPYIVEPNLGLEVLWVCHLLSVLFLYSSHTGGCAPYGLQNYT